MSKAKKIAGPYDSLSKWEGVCKKLGIDPKVKPGTEGMSEDDANFTIAAYQAKKITQAYNKVDEEAGETSIPNKYPYFWRGKEGGAGFSFRSSGCDHWFSDANANAAARLCGFKTWAAADHAGPAHEKVWKMLVHGK